MAYTDSMDSPNVTGEWFLPFGQFPFLQGQEKWQ